MEGRERERALFMLRQLLGRHRAFLLYCLIGGSGVALDCGVFWALTAVGGLHYQAANAIGVSCGICNNFFLNAFLNFRRTDRLWWRFLSFCCVGFIGLAISAGLLWLLVGQWGWEKRLAKATIVFVVTVAQFSLNTCVTFRRRTSDESL